MGNLSLNTCRSTFPKTPMKINEDSVPATFLEAVHEMYNAMDSVEKVYVAEKNWFADHHFTTGMFLRNNWSLWDVETPLVKDCIQIFKLYGHGDDISGLIAAGVGALARGEDPMQAAKKEADKYRKHWEMYGIDPLTGKVVGEGTKSIRIVVDEKTGEYNIMPGEDDSA